MRTAAIALAVLVAAAASAGDGWFTTAAGVQVRTPAIAGLDCPTMRRVLDAIDASGYRKDAPAPADAADMALLDYEHRLSSAYYADCVRAAADPAMSAEVFRGGYEGD